MILTAKLQKEIYLAGGCFWGLQTYFKQLPGIYETTVGYANGNTKNPSYEDVCKKDTGYAETVQIRYKNAEISLETILEAFFKVIDPTSLNRQGNDHGSQYRTGIYYTTADDLPTIKRMIEYEKQKYDKPVVTEILPLTNFYLAEEYHQDYLDKNPHGYCHISPNAALNFIKAKGLSTPNLSLIIKQKNYHAPCDSQLKEKLSDIQYQVTKQSATERPFTSEYVNNFTPGLYVDITTGEPLFTSMDKYDSGCGWPSFSKPITPQSVTEHADTKLNTPRIETRSRLGDSHLGHVFPERGGMRYCINGASLRFIPIDKLQEEGYDYLQYLFEKKNK